MFEIRLLQVHTRIDYQTTLCQHQRVRK